MIHTSTVVSYNRLSFFLACTVIAVGLHSFGRIHCSCSPSFAQAQKFGPGVWYSMVRSKVLGGVDASYGTAHLDGRAEFHGEIPR